MAIVENQIVSIEYEAYDQKTRELVDGNIGHEPLEFIMGHGNIISGLENGIKDLEIGQKADILVDAKDAYGDYNNEAIDTLPKEQFSGIDLTEGMTLYGQDEQGHTIPVVVQSFDENNVTIDYNHPMAGKDLMFSITIVSTRVATPSEISSGAVDYQHNDSCSTGSSCSC